MYQLAVDFRRQMLEPVGIVAAQGDIQRQDIFHFISVYGLITNRCASSGEAVQEGFAAFFRRTGEETALSGFKKIHSASVALLRRRLPPFLTADDAHIYRASFSFAAADGWETDGRISASRGR
ncbi:Uncharacterised protein [Salmonella sp. NCTC 11881]|nr:Uncharacterised protein [Salmonella sp. NCTC 11881]